LVPPEGGPPTAHHIISTREDLSLLWLAVKKTGLQSLYNNSDDTMTFLLPSNEVWQKKATVCSDQCVAGREDA